MKNFQEIKAFEDVFEVFYLPKARIIGKEVRNGGSMGNTAPSLWKEVFETGVSDVLLALPHVLKASLYGWTCDYDAETDTFSYIVCALTLADTPIPEGFVFKDIPETICAKGLYGEGMPQTIERINEYGYTTNWELYGWNAELYIQAEEDNPPKQVDMPWHWIVPIKKKGRQSYEKDELAKRNRRRQKSALFLVS